MQAHDSPQARPSAPETAQRPGGQGRVLLAAVIALVVGLAGGAASTAFGLANGPWHDRGFLGGPIDPATVDRRVERMMKHLAIEADATDDQQSKLVTIAKAAASDLLPLREKALANRQRVFELFTGASIDRAAIEQLRSEEVGLADTAAKRLAQALADAADVLSAEQRRTLVDRLSAWHWGHWHHS